MLYAHAQAGMFGPLLSPGGKVGQHVDVTRPGQATLRYRISQFFPRWSPSDIRYTQPADHEELVLLTCTSYDPNGPRILAVAEPDTTAGLSRFISDIRTGFLVPACADRTGKSDDR